MRKLFCVYMPCIALVSFVLIFTSGEISTLSAQNARKATIPKPVNSSTKITLQGIDSIAKKLEQELNPGNWVTRGEFTFFSKEDCIELLKNPTVGNCQGNNPSSPYGMYYFPPAKGEYIDNGRMGKTWADFDCHCENSVRVITDENKNTTLYRAWRLRQDEAMVFIGLTPPKCKYFSFRSYIGRRDVKKCGKIGKVLTKLKDLKSKEDIDRFTVFASLGDSINNFRILTTGSDENPEVNNQFEQLTVLITTANKTMAANLKSQIEAILVQNRIKPDIINIDGLSTKIPLYMGHDRDSDEFIMFLRSAFFDSQDAKEAFLSSPTAVILRILPNEELVADAFDVPVLLNKKSSYTEKPLKDNLDKLVKAVSKEFKTKKFRNAAAEEFKRIQIKTRKLKNFKFEGLDCLKYSIPCLGDNRDAEYFISEQYDIPESKKGSIMVVGINHSIAGPFVYSSLTLQNQQKLLGVFSVKDTQLKGSVQYYFKDKELPIPKEDQDKFYVAMFSRSCEEANPFCFEIPMPDIDAGKLGIDPDDKFLFAERVYVNKETFVGPEGDDLVTPYTIDLREKDKEDKEDKEDKK